jgi:hypothetical protein
MCEESYLYILVRVRKSGSQSLLEMMKSSHPNQRIFQMPPNPPLADFGVGVLEDFRRIRRTKKRLWKLFRTMSLADAWKYLDANAESGDIISGHMMYGVPELPRWELRYITLMREPLGRLYSEYRYCRQSFLQRPRWRRVYLSARLKVAGNGTFADYIDYLYGMRERFANPLVSYIVGDMNPSNVYEFLKENYYHYGTLEHIEEFAAGLSAKVGVPVNTVWQNQTRVSSCIENEQFDTDKVEALIGLDIELYLSVCDEVCGGPDLSP